MENSGAAGSFTPDPIPWEIWLAPFLSTFPESDPFLAPHPHPKGSSLTWLWQQHRPWPHPFCCSRCSSLGIFLYFKVRMMGAWGTFAMFWCDPEEHPQQGDTAFTSGVPEGGPEGKQLCSPGQLKQGKRKDPGLLTSCTVPRPRGHTGFLSLSTKEKSMVKSLIVASFHLICFSPGHLCPAPVSAISELYSWWLMTLASNLEE